MTYISCIAMSEGIIREAEGLPDDEDDKQFEELYQLFTSNSLIIQDFAVYVNSTLLFPPIKIEEEVKKSERSKSRRRNKSMEPRHLIKQELTLQEFQVMMLKDNLDCTLLRPHEMRQRFTEYVIMNQAKALINTSLLSKEDSFFVKQSIRKGGNNSMNKGKKKKMGQSQTFKKIKPTDQEL